MTYTTENTCIIVGGGAAGFFTAINILEHHPTYKVMILEKSSKVLQKVKVSGGGRCNLSHHCMHQPTLISNYPRGQAFLKKVFEHFSVKDTINWFASHDVKLKIESDNRMFPTANTSDAVISCFMRSFLGLGGEIIYQSEVTKIDTLNDGFALHTKMGKTYRASHVIITTGGMPQLNGYGYLANMGIKINPPLPSLFTFNIKPHELSELMGISFNHVGIKIINTDFSFSGPLLITHWGFSGPAVLKLSAFAAQYLHQQQYEFMIEVNWSGEKTVAAMIAFLMDIKQTSAKTWQGIGAEIKLPKRFYLYLLNKAGILAEKKIAETANKDIEKLAKLCCAHPYQVHGKTTFKEEFVTCGGVDLDEVHPDTMESKKHRGLFFAGEVLDIDGITGGFNFQSAWSTAFVASQLGKKQV